jgi:hypothetical protein
MRRLILCALWLLTVIPVVFSAIPAGGKPGDPVKLLKQPPAETKLNTPEVLVPMLGTTTMPLVQVYLNGKGPFFFLVNTGSDFILVQKELATTLGMPVLQKLGKRSICELKELSLGEGVFKGMVVAVDEWEKGIDGILGFNLFGNCVLTIDFPGERYQLSMKHLDPPDGAEILKYKTGKSLCPFLPIQVGQKTILFLINTGIQTYLQIRPESESNFHFKFPPMKIHPTLSFPVAADARVGRVSDDFNLGRHMILQPVISILPSEDHMIGCGVLQNFILSFDPANKTMRIYRNSEVPIIVPSIRELGFKAQNKEGGCFITEVAGWMNDLSIDVKVGDQVLSVESIPAGSLSSNDWISFERNLNYFELTLLRNGEERSLEVPLKIIIP